MPQKLTLENAGDTATFTITTAKTVQTKFGDRLAFAGIDAEGTEVETPLIPEATGVKQLDRLGLTTETCVGETLTFSRAANPSGKPYWNIDAAKPQAAPTKRLAAPVATEVVGGLDARMSIANAYLGLYKHVRVALPNEAGEAVQAATATIWITWDKRGIQPDGKTAKPSAPTPAQTPAVSSKRLAPPTAAPEYANFPPPSDADATDDLPFD
jgi:hypothetical protein